MQSKILISACLMGEKVKYDGGDNALHSSFIDAWNAMGLLVPICPEVMGGLSVPRIASEVVLGGKNVINQKGEDVTYAFNVGAQEALKQAHENNISMAILKARSPSCGKNVIYDGTFSGTKVHDSGVTCKLLQANGIMVFSEEELEMAYVFWSK